MEDNYPFPTWADKEYILKRSTWTKRLIDEWVTNYGREKAEKVLSGDNWGTVDQFFLEAARGH